MRLPICILQILFALLSTGALAGTSDPSGIAGLFIVVVFVAPLVLLVLIAAAVGGVRGAAVGVLIYLVSLMFFKHTTHNESEQNLMEYDKEIMGWSEACLHEAGEVGEPIASPIKNVLVYIDPLLEKSWFSPRFSKEDASPSTQFISSIPEKIVSGEILVVLRLIDREIEGAGTRRIRGIETDIRDSEGKLGGKRVNFIFRGDSCLFEREDLGIERFLRRTLGAQYVLFSSIKQEEWISTEYPIGRLSTPEKGEFVPNPASQVEDLKAIARNEWSKGIYGDERTWFIRAIPTSTSNSNIDFLDRVVIEQRTGEGKSLKRFVVRFPRMQVMQTFSLADIQISADQMELHFLTKKCPSPQDPLKYEYCERVRLTIPTLK